MKTLDDLKPDHNNQVYFDNEVGRFYIIIWEEGYYDTPYRFYIQPNINGDLCLNPNPVIK